MSAPLDKTSQDHIASPDESNAVPDSDSAKDPKAGKPVKWWLADLGEVVLEIAFSIWR